MPNKQTSRVAAESNEQWWSKFMKYTQHNDSLNLLELIEKSDVKKLKGADCHRNTFLHYVSPCLGGRGPARYLKEIVGCDINAKNIFGDSVLKYAFIFNNNNLIKYLLINGVNHKQLVFTRADLQCRFQNFFVKISFPVGEQFKVINDTILNNLSEVKGCNILRDNRWTALHIAILNCSTNGLTSVHRANFDVIEELIKAGADVNKGTAKKNTPLHYAVFLNDKRVTELLIKAGADVNALNNEKQSTLLHAMRFKQVDLINTLLDAGANVNIANGQRRNCFYYAMKLKDFEIFLKLVNKGIIASRKYNSHIGELILDIRDTFKDDYRHQYYDPNVIYDYVRCIELLLANDKRLSTTQNKKLFFIYNPSEEIDFVIMKLMVIYGYGPEYIFNNKCRTGFSTAPEPPIVQHRYQEKLRSYIRNNMRKKAQGVPEDSWEFFSEYASFCQEYSKRCEREIEYMKTLKYTTGATVYDIFKSKDMTKFLYDPDVVRDFSNLTKVKEFFPQFGEILSVQYVKDKIKQDLQNQADLALARAVKLDRDSFYVIIRHIRQYLDIQDLRKLSFV